MDPEVERDNYDMVEDIIRQTMALAMLEVIEQTKGEEEFPENGLPLADKELQLADLTQSECLEACRLVVCYLYDSYQALFDRMFLLSVKDKNDSEESAPAASLRFFLGSGHTYFLVRSVGGRWFAGSPANYIPGERDNRLLRLHQSNKLQEVIRAIQQTDGGQWPSSTLIEDVSDAELFLPKIETDDGSKSLKVTCFYQKGGEAGYVRAPLRSI